ncbi:MAG: hypothetical protein K0R94_553 [Burkholderiales bacterium]|nr:hypothetical protein [Burkholderiales bacterium]
MIMTAMIFLGMAAMDIYVPALPQMVSYFTTTPKIINLTLACYTFGIAIGVLFVGELSNRFGRRKLLLYAITTFALTSFIIATLHSIIIVIACRIVQALCNAVFIVVSRLVLKDCLDHREQLSANGLLLTSLVISPAIAPIIGACLLEHYGWQSTFFLLSGLSFVLSLLTYKVVPETHNNILTSFQPITYYINIYRNFLTNRIYLYIVLISSCTTSAYFSFLGISSYLFILHWGFTPESYSLLFLMVAAAYLTGNISMQILNRLGFSIDKIITYGLIATAGGSMVMAVSPLFSTYITIILVISGTFLMRMATALVNPATQIKLLDKFSDNKAQAIGLNFCISFCFNSLAISSVTLFVTKPLLGLILVSDILILLAIICYFITRASSSK